MKLVRYNSVPSLFDDFVDRHFGKSFQNGASFFLPSVDVAETDKEFEIHVSAPGMDKKDFNLELNNGQLTISGERKFEKEDKKRNYHSIESRYGKFTRSFYLPDNVNGEKIQASYQNGILNISIPKDEKKETKNLIDIK